MAGDLLPDDVGATEVIDDRFAELDRMSSLELAAVMNDADALVPAAVGRALPAIATAADAIADRLARGGRLIYVGAGTSGRLGVLDAAECPPTFGTDPGQVIALIAGGSGAIAATSEGAEDDRRAAADDVAAADVTAADVVVGVASSGKTPYVLAAIDAARARGATTVGVACNADSPLSAAVDHAIEVVVGPEVVAGSTRLKAGTAQKLVLNMLSTIAMIRSGRTFGNLMVDLRPTNEKLRRRAERIVAAIAEVSPTAARRALADTDFNIKLAAVIAATGLRHDEAVERLQRADGRLRLALGRS